jgi:PAS domain S-box-containing protein
MTTQTANDSALSHAPAENTDNTNRERALSDAQKGLRAAHEQAEHFINAVPAILIGIDESGCITRWNRAAAAAFGLSAHQVMTKPLDTCGIVWGRSDMQAEIDCWCREHRVGRIDNVPFQKGDVAHFLGLTLAWVTTHSKEARELLIIGSDVTERKGLEEQLRQAQKLEAIGQLAAGIAHEINTPTQYVGDNTSFLKESWLALAPLLKIALQMRKEADSGQISSGTLQEFDRCARAADPEYLESEIPHAIEQSLDGIQRVAKIVRAMKEFSHPGSEEKQPADINKAIETTVTVARNEWKYVADVIMKLGDNLPLVPCHLGEFNQVILNVIINAAHAIAQVVGDGGKGKGKITIATRQSGDSVEIAISDTGAGIPERIRSRIFEPFFTTKPLGKGTGQGLALAHNVIVRRCGGKLWFDTEPGKGTTFYISLPLVAKTSE